MRHLEHSQKQQPEVLRVAVVGGGLGGLVLARALLRAKSPHRTFNVTVYERDEAPEAREQGYLIGLSMPGIDSLERVMFPALRAFLDESSRPEVALTHFTLADKHLDAFCVLEATGQYRSVAVNRWKLRETLANTEDDNINIVWNKRLLSYEEHADHVTIHFEDDSTTDADVVVGADGAKSLVRAQRCPQLQLVDTHVVNIEGRSPRPSAAEAPLLAELLKSSMMRVFGNNGATMLLMPWTSPTTGEHEVMWTLTQDDAQEGAREAAAPNSDPQLVMDFCLRQVREGHIHPEVEALVGKMVRDGISRGGRLWTIMHPANDNPLGSTTRVTLLGDAAHAMTTHMGMGANTAFQDAVDLADALQENDWQASLAQYEAKMMRRGLDVAQKSLQMTRLIIASSLTMRNLRYALFSVIGAFVVVGSFIRSVKEYFSRPSQPPSNQSTPNRTTVEVESH